MESLAIAFIGKPPLPPLDLQASDSFAGDPQNSCAEGEERKEKKISGIKSCDTHVNIVCMNWVLHLLLAAEC